MNESVQTVFPSKPNSGGVNWRAAMPSLTVKKDLSVPSPPEETAL